MLIFEFSPSILLTLGCGCTSGVGSGAFGVSSVSAASVPGGVGGGTGSLSQTGSQGRQGRQGCWHTLVVIHPRNTVNTIKKQQLIFNYGHAASLPNLWKFVFVVKNNVIHYITI